MVKLAGSSCATVEPGSGLIVNCCRRVRDHVLHEGGIASAIHWKTQFGYPRIKDALCVSAIEIGDSVELHGAVPHQARARVQAAAFEHGIRLGQPAPGFRNPECDRSFEITGIEEQGPTQRTRVCGRSIRSAYLFPKLAARECVRGKTLRHVGGASERRSRTHFIAIEEKPFAFNKRRGQRKIPVSGGNHFPELAGHKCARRRALLHKCGASEGSSRTHLVAFQEKSFVFDERRGQRKIPIPGGDHFPKLAGHKCARRGAVVHKGGASEEGARSHFVAFEKETFAFDKCRRQRKILIALRGGGIGVRHRHPGSSQEFTIHLILKRQPVGRHEQTIAELRDTRFLPRQRVGVSPRPAG